MTLDERFTRRGSLARFGTLLAAVAGGGVAVSRADSEGPAAVSSGLVTCMLTPELTEGPYYLPGEKVRRNITDGHPGTPLALRLTVVDASTCRPIKGASVDVWHADAAGVYSGFGSGASSRTFMRGIQPTNANGLASLITVYPGWYTGRTVHIHVKVHAGGTVVHTGQLFFSDAITDAVYKRPPYASRPNRDTRNAQDSIFVNGGKRSLLALKRSESGWTASITMGVHRT
jgi:protocatechuate 3,4-dioxygenase beta subunit